jgi:O-antigen/teichoic acid export membrane protein
MVRVGSILLALTAINAALSGALAGFEAFRTLTHVGVVVGLVSLPVLVTAAVVGGLPGAVWGWVSILSLQGALSYLAVRREAARAGTPLQHARCLCEWPVLWSFSLPAALSGLLSAPTVWISHALLVNQPGGFAQMGVFNAANQWRMAILFVPQKIVTIALPVLSSLAAEGRLDRFRTTLRLCILVSAGASIAVAAPMIAFSSWIMRLYGEDFAAGASTLSLLAVSAVFMSISFVGGQAVISLGRAWFRVAVHVLWSAALLTSLPVLVLGGGTAASLAVVNVIAYAVHCLAQYVFLRRAWNRFRPDAHESAVRRACDEGEGKMAA